MILFSNSKVGIVEHNRIVRFFQRSVFSSRINPIAFGKVVQYFFVCSERRYAELTLSLFALYAHLGAAAPSLYKVAVVKEQSIYLGQPVSDIVYHWGNTATSAVVEWTGDNEANIIPLASVPAGTYNYSLTSTHKSIHIGVSEQAAGYLTPEFFTIVKNAVDYVVDTTLNVDLSV